MALPALLGAGARAIGGSMVKAGGRSVVSKVLGRRGTQSGRIISGGGGKGGGGGGAIVPSTKMVSPKEMKSLRTGDPVPPGKDPLKSIYSNVIIIEKILKGTYASERDQLRKQRQDDKKSDKAAQEKKLETKPTKIDKKKGLMKKIPSTGIFGMIKNFIGSILLGYFAVRLVKYLPQLVGLLKGLAKVVEFVTDVGIFLVDGLASFINFSYNVYDGTRNIAKKLGGDALLGAFDGLMKAVEVAITVLTFALGAKSLGGFGDSRGGGKPGRGKPRTRVAGPRGNLLGSQDRVTSSAAARRYANRFGRDAAEKRFGADAVSGLGGKYGRSRVTNVVRKGATGIANKIGGRSGVKALSSLGKIGSKLKVPVIGSIISVVISLMNGDPIQKALFKGIGTVIGGIIGGAITGAGTFFTAGVGAFLAPIVMGISAAFGDFVGDLLYTLFFDGGIGAAGKKLADAVMGFITGTGDLIKGIFNWVFGGGLFKFLKDAAGGLAKFVVYLLNPGGLLWDIIKTTGAAYKAIFDWIFGGGLLNLIKSIGGGLLKFIGYIFLPNGLMNDVLKMGGKALKFVFDWVFGGGLIGLIKNVSGGMARFISYILMPNGLLYDALKMGGNISKMIFNFAMSIVGNIAEGTKRAGAGFADFLTFNLFDFDKKNKVESKKAGGSVGRGFQQDTLKQQKKAIRKKPSFTKLKAPAGGKIKTGKKTDQAWWDFLGWAGTGGQDEMMDLGPGGQLLANRAVKVGNSFGEHPFFGPILSLAAKIILGQTPNEREYKNVGYGLNMLIGEGVAKGKIGEGIKGYEDGGMIDDYNAMLGIDVGRWATDAFRKELSNTLYKNFDVMNPGSTAGPGTSAGVRDPATGELVSGTGATPGPGGIIPQGQMTGTPSQQEAFNKIYNIAKQVGGAKFPELVAAHSMQETGYLANPNSIFFNSGKTNAFGQTIFAREVGTNGIVNKIWHADRWWAVYDSIESSVKHHIKLWHNTNKYKNNYNAFDKYTEAMAVIIPKYSSDADPENIRRGFSEDAYAKGMFNHLKLGGFDPMGPTGTRKIVQNTPATPNAPNVQPLQPGQTGKGSEAAQKLLNDFPQIKSRGSSQQIYASGLGHYLKTVGAGRGKGIGDYGDPAGSTDQMEHPDHGGVVASHAGTGHYRGVALDLGANSATSGSYTQDQKNLWPHISKFLHKYGLHKDPYVPQVIHGPGESFSPKAASSFADRAHHNHFHVEFHKGGLVGGDGEVPALLKSGEIVIDNDSSISKVLPMLLAINKAKDEKGVLNAIRNYAPYEAGAEQTVVVVDPPQQQEDSSNSSGSGGMIPTGGSSHDPFEFLDYQG